MIELWVLLPANNSLIFCWERKKKKERKENSKLLKLKRQFLFVSSKNSTVFLKREIKDEITNDEGAGFCCFSECSHCWRHLVSPLVPANVQDWEAEDDSSRTWILTIQVESRDPEINLPRSDLGLCRGFQKPTRKAHKGWQGAAE